MNEPIRVLCVFSTLDRGGAETMCMNLYRHIDRAKVQFDFVKHTKDGGAYEDEIKSLGGKIYSAPRYKIYNHFQYVKWWKNFLSKHPEYKIIHGHYFTISAIYFHVAKKLGAITIGHSHAVEPKPHRFKERGRWYIEHLVEREADYCLACSTDAGNWLFPNKAFIVLNNAIDVKEFSFNQIARERIRKEYGLTDSFVIGAVGTIKNIKNPYGIVDIYQAVLDKCNTARLLWIGDGPMKKEIEQYVCSIGLQSNVIFAGMRNDVADLLQAMDIFVFPSKSEGLGMAAIEAQAAGLQCFCSDQVPREAAVTDRCYFLPLGNPSKWADEICKCDCTHVDMTQKIIDAGYDIHQTAQWLEDFYYSLIK